VPFLHPVLIKNKTKQNKNTQKNTLKKQQQKKTRQKKRPNQKSASARSAATAWGNRNSWSFYSEKQEKTKTTTTP